MAEDLAQDVFVSALRASKSFKGDSKLYTWLVGIARHKIIDYYRSKQHEIVSTSDFPDPSAEALSSGFEGQSTADDLGSADLKIDVAKVLAALPLDYRQVLLLKYVEGMTVVEISQLMHRSPKAIDGVLTRARNVFKENLSDNAR